MWTGMGDFVYIGRGFTELKAFFEIVPDLLEGPESVFSFWNGLGATSECRFCRCDDVALQLVRGGRLTGVLIRFGLRDRSVDL